ncbi:type VI secretion protein IcmF [Herbaspirillum rubrisubalbicans M1]|uniref:type VI secretion system protein n=1 Tax=Herbaspirillum rubrisubalbicans TaxID=80842 RepID=UPI00073A11DB|nr:type VI secretion system protein [Herbaspirillum rubrisubalbicans]ALU89506.1 type VI secretion protein IcmF [Herbaspirillum rubrisubalbicans M1]
MLLYIVIACAVLIALVLSILIWRARKPVRKPLGAFVARCRRLLAMLLWHPLAYLTTPRESSYRSTWILVIGQQGAGKSSLLASLDPTQWQTPSEQQQALIIDGSDWLFLPRGVLIDPPGRWSAAEANSQPGRVWKGFLGKLDLLRPERPIDAVLLVVSARSLQADSGAQRLTLAESLRAQLALLERQVEFSLPVYVVISEMDTVSGFAAFWQTQCAVQRREMVGWSMPLTTGSEATEQWVDHAFDYLSGQLRDLQIQVAAKHHHADPAQIDQFMLFPRHLQQLREPVRACMAQVFQASSWQTGCFCRGLYFTGALPAEDASAIAAGDDLARNDIAFVDDLVIRKILAEPRLARPTRHGIWSRSTLLRRLQLTGVTMLVVLFAALAWASVELQRQEAAGNSALVALQQLAQQAGDGSQGSASCAPSDVVAQALEQIGRYPGHPRYWPIPASWLGDRAGSDNAQRLITGVLQNLVLSGVACRLGQQAQLLMAEPAPVAPATAGSGATLAFETTRRALLARSGAILRWQQNQARFDDIAITPADLKRHDLLTPFIALYNDVYGASLSVASTRNKAVLQTALRRAQYTTALNLPAQMKAQLAGQLDRDSQQLAREMQQEVGAGADLLTQLERPGTALLPATRHFSHWLDWVGSAWSGSSAQDNPCSSVATQLQRQADQLRAYGYPEAELRSMTGHFSTSSCYTPNLATLSGMQMAPYGSLFTQDAKGLALNTQLRAEQAGLKALLALDFMQIEDTRPFICQTKVAGWRASDIGLSNRYVTQYTQFISGAQPSTPVSDSNNGGASQQPLYQRIALRQLEAALNNNLSHAQIAAGPAVVAVDVSASEDQALARESSNFGALLEPLLSLLRSYRSLNFAASATQLNQCIGSYSSDSLARVQNLSDISLLYDVSSTDAGPMFDLGTTPVIKDYLARQVARTQVLAGYASAFLTYLNNSGGQNNARNGNAQSAAYWSNTINELNRYVQFKEPAGQVAQLDQLFLKQMPDLDTGNCADILSTYKPADYGNDLFSAHRLKLESLIQANCQSGRDADASQAYSRLATRFNRELAGRYPFGPLGSADASLVTVRQFFADYMAQRASLRASLQGLSGPYWTSAQQFLNQLDATGKFFQGTLSLTPTPPAAAKTTSTAPADSDSNAALASTPVKLAVQFHAQPGNSSGAEQLVNWALSSGSKQAAFPNRGTTLDWAYGQALVLDLTWASGSQWQPAPDLQQTDLDTSGLGASFSASGDWALLRLIEKHQPANGYVASSKEPNKLMLEFLVPVTSNGNATGKLATSTAKLYVGLNLSGTDPKTHAAVSLKLPQGFPRSAP